MRQHPKAQRRVVIVSEPPRRPRFRFPCGSGIIVLMDISSRLEIINWLVGQSLTGLPENDILRGFCERCRAAGIELSRGLATPRLRRISIRITKRSAVSTRRCNA